MSSYSIIVCPKEKLDPYLGLIYSKWLRSLRAGNDYFKLVHPSCYYPAYHRYIQSILNNEATEIRIAALSEDLDVVLGFSVSRGTILDYVYVTHNFRRMGIGRQLVPDGIDTITHLTRTGATVWSKTKNIKFNPFC